jgi:phage shock protein B
MEEAAIVPIIVIPTIFIGLPWIIFHYITKWKSMATISQEDEKLLDDLFDLARRLEDRVITIERIIAADKPDWKNRL